MIIFNNRQAPRVMMRSNAVMLMQNGYVDVSVLDLSMTGALIEIDDPQPLARDSRCALRLLSGCGRQLLEFETAVARVAGERRVGLMASNLSPGARSVLRSLLDNATRAEMANRREVCALLRPVNPSNAPANCPTRIELPLAQHAA